MKIFFTLLLLALFFQSSGQPTTADPPAADSSKRPIKIGLHCAASVVKDTPLWIVDDRIVAADKINSIDPGIIERVWILKGDSATALYGRRAMHGVIIISTKKVSALNLQIRDSIDGSSIAGATCTVVATSKAIAQQVASAEGNAVINTRLAEHGDGILVSFIGYVSKLVTRKELELSKNNLIKLERLQVECTPVVIMVYPPIICSRITQTICTSQCREESITGVPLEIARHGSNFKSAFFSLYPNPVARGASVNIDVKQINEAPFQIRIMDLEGKLVWAESGQRAKQNSRSIINTDSRWSAGIYFIQLLNDKGQMLCHQKMIIQ